MIVVCSYCKRQRVDGQWVDALPIAESELVSHGICDPCYWITMTAAGFTEIEIAEDLNGGGEHDAR